MQVRVNLKIFIFLVIVYFTRQIHIYSIMMLFAIIHELAHLITGLLMGLKPEKIELMPLGLSVSFKTSNKDYNKKVKKASVLSIKKMIIAAAGPLINIIIAIFLIYIDIGINDSIRSEIIFSNVLIAIFNLIPIYPMDGGRILKEIIHIYKGSKTAYIDINKVSNITIIILTVIASFGIYYYKNISLLLIIIYLWGLVFMENKRYRIKKRIFDIIDAN